MTSPQGRVAHRPLGYHGSFKTTIDRVHRASVGRKGVLLSVLPCLEAFKPGSVERHHLHSQPPMKLPPPVCVAVQHFRHLSIQDASKDIQSLFGECARNAAAAALL
jgi:hypothetical protein